MEEVDSKTKKLHEKKDALKDKLANLQAIANEAKSKVKINQIKTIYDKIKNKFLLNINLKNKDGRGQG